MTDEQKQLVRESFESIRDMAEPTAMLFYGRLFSMDPSLRKMFKPDVKAQAGKLMDTLATVIGSIDQLDRLRPTMRELGKRHLEYGVKPEHYDAVAAAFLWALGHALQGECHPDVKAAWGRLLQDVSEEMKRGAGYRVSDSGATIRM